LTHRASRLLWGRSRLSHAQRVTHLAASQSRSFGVVRQSPLHPREGARKDTDQSTKTTQDGNLPRFMMSKASNASSTGIANSVVILVSLWLLRGFANFAKKTNFLIEVHSHSPLITSDDSVVLTPPNLLNRATKLGALVPRMVSMKVNWSQRAPD